MFDSIFIVCNKSEKQNIACCILLVSVYLREILIHYAVETYQ